MPVPASCQLMGRNGKGRSFEAVSMAPVSRRMVCQNTGIRKAAVAPVARTAGRRSRVATTIRATASTEDRAPLATIVANDESLLAMRG
jgi:hypothetical protein